MATIPFFAAQSNSISSSKYVSGFMDFNYRASHSKLFFLRTPRLNHSRRRRRNLSFMKIASDQRQELKDPINEEGSTASNLFIF